VIAIFIAGTSFVVFLSVLSSTLKTQTQERDYIIAANLAQEGIELVRNIRDNNWKSGKTAFDLASGFSDISGQTINYCVDYNNNRLAARQGRSKCPVSINGSSNSKFTRTIAITTPTDKDKREIKSTVYWGASNSVEVTDTLYAWGNKE